MKSDKLNMRDSDSVIEGKNAVLEAFRAGKTIDRLFILDGIRDSTISSILREAKKNSTVLDFVPKSRLDEMCPGDRHQGVVAYIAAYEYATVDEILQSAADKNEDPFIILLDDVEDPHNLGAIIRSANCAGVHGIIIPKRHSSGLTSTVSKASAGAINYTPVAKVTNLVKTMEELKKKGIWFACADMDGTPMYDLNLTGPIGIVIGNEGKGVGQLVRKTCDMVASIPINGEIESLNDSVASGILSYEVVRQRIYKSKVK